MRCLKISSIIRNFEHDRLVRRWVCFRNIANEAETQSVLFCSITHKIEVKNVYVRGWFPYQTQQQEDQHSNTVPGSRVNRNTVKFRGKFKVHLFFNPGINSTFFLKVNGNNFSAPFYPQFVLYGDMMQKKGPNNETTSLAARCHNRNTIQQRQDVTHFQRHTRA